MVNNTNTNCATTKSADRAEIATDLIDDLTRAAAAQPLNVGDPERISIMKRPLVWLVGAVACAATFGQALPGQAAQILGVQMALSDLIANNGTVTAGDKLFSDFTYAFTGDMPAASGVNIIPIQDLDGNYGIRIQGLFTDTTFSVGGSDALITYNVTATDPRYLITDAHIQGNTRIIDRDGTGTGEISVVDTFLPLGAGGEFTMDIQDKKSATEDITRLVDWTFFDQGYRTLPVQKDIGAFAVTNSVTASFIDQTYSQTLIPEPSTIGLIGVLGLGLIGTRRRC